MFLQKSLSESLRVLQIKCIIWANLTSTFVDTPPGPLCFELSRYVVCALHL